MSDAHPSNPLQRAHALSAQAHELLVPINPSLASLNTALRYFQEATDLFDAASNSSVGEGDQGKTLRMLVVQHRKLAKDVERRINALTRAGPSSHSMGASPPSVGRFSAVGGYRGLGSPEAGPSRPGLAQRRVVSEAGSAHMRSGEVTLGPGVGMGGPSMQNPGGIAFRLSPPMGIPPFALRPPSTFPPMASTSASPTIPLPAAAASGSTNTTSARATQPSLSPLYSSSSSSSAPEESYIHFGPPPDASKMDPFSRFWGMLENMLEEVSNPVVFASAPMGPGPGQAQAPGSDVSAPQGKALDNKNRGKERKRTQKDNERDKLRDRNGGEVSTKPEESFYMVRKGKQREPSEDEEEDIGEGGGRATTPNAPKKTSEELLMENESLKTSLDALSLHAQSVERNNQLLKAQLADRDKGFRTAVENIKREANRGKEVWRSQLLASSPTTSTSLAKPTPSRNPLPTVPDAAVASGGNGGVAGGSNAGAAGKMNSPVEKGGVARGHNEEVSRRRIQELEDQVRTLRLENEKQRSQIDKYKDRIDKIKVNARAKKEAKLAAEAEARAASPRS